jgi:hypothetical protein
VQREELIEALEAPGLLVLPNVTNKVKLLIAADPDSESAKCKSLKIRYSHCQRRVEHAGNRTGD